jgi:hypothetical protein
MGWVRADSKTTSGLRTLVAQVLDDIKTEGSS